MHHPKRASNKLSLWFERNQAVFCLPFLVRILSVRVLEKETIVDNRLFNVQQVVIGGGPEKIGICCLRNEFGTLIQRPNHRRVVFVLASRKRKVGVGISHIGLELEGGQQ